MAREASVHFHTAGQRRSADVPTAHLARIGWLLLRLLFDGVVEYAACVDHFGISRREFQRDLSKLRELGKDHGFTISRTQGGRVFCQQSVRRAPMLIAKKQGAAATLARIAAALGGPVLSEARDAFGDFGAAPDGFLHLRGPLPAADDHITRVFEFLKSAAAGPACVEFSYTPARGGRMARRAEPYHVVARSGRYYLVAYDLTRREWRYFALDAIAAPMRKAGTFSRKPVPERFLSERGVGWFGGPKTVDVTVRVSPLVAAAIRSRTWQRDERLAPSAGGGVEITLDFADLGEAVRWAMGFGSEAVIVAPPEAVHLARDEVARIARAYTKESDPAGELLTG